MGGMGRERIHNMKHDFKFISKHSPQVKSAYSDLMEIISLVHDDLRKQYTFQHKPVGSYSRDMITYDAKSNIGFDFDINIYPNDEENRFTAKQIKLLFKQSLDKFAHRYGYDFAEDSSVLRSSSSSMGLESNAYSEILRILNCASFIIRTVWRSGAGGASVIVFPSIILRINCSLFIMVLSTIAFSRESSASLK